MSRNETTTSSGPACHSSAGYTKRITLSFFPRFISGRSYEALSRESSWTIDRAQSLSGGLLRLCREHRSIGRCDCLCLAWRQCELTPRASSPSLVTFRTNSLPFIPLSSNKGQMCPKCQAFMRRSRRSGNSRPGHCPRETPRCVTWNQPLLRPVVGLGVKDARR